MKKTLCFLCQCSWGAAQTLLGAVFWLLFCPGKRPVFWRGALVLCWKQRAGASLGLFLFLPEGLDGPGCPALFRAMRVHEYGHFLQSMLLGPLYLPLIALPSALWCFLPACVRLRERRKMSYYDFFPERWADLWGSRAAGEPSMGNLPVHGREKKGCGISREKNGEESRF